jgi:hypothetical protein
MMIAQSSPSPAITSAYGQTVMQLITCLYHNCPVFFTFAHSETFFNALFDTLVVEIGNDSGGVSSSPDSGQ